MMPTPSLPSPIIDVTSRTIRPDVKLQLYVRAGGRCEFDGCNAYLLEHPVTLDRVNLGEVAHIVAFAPTGPRGTDPARPSDEAINQIENLMLLCLGCHEYIDKKPGAERFTRANLEEHKRAHEERIFRLTECRPDRKTTILQLKAKVGGQAVAISDADVWNAVAPRYPADREGVVIDLTTVEDGDPRFLELAAEEIKRETFRLYRRGMAAPIEHLSLFAIAPMPLLMLLGIRLSNKVPVDFYQRHRDTQDWTWKVGGATAVYTHRRLRSGSDASSVALLLSLSAPLDPAALPANIDARYSVYEITLRDVAPSPLFLRTRADLDAFRVIYHDLLATIIFDHPELSTLDVFPAVPAPVAVLCGYELFPKISPALNVYDKDARKGGWIPALKITPS